MGSENTATVLSCTDPHPTVIARILLFTVCYTATRLFEAPIAATIAFLWTGVQRAGIETSLLIMKPVAGEVWALGVLFIVLTMDSVP